MSSTEFPTSDRREPSLEGPPLGDPSAIHEDRPGPAAPWDESAPLSDSERPAFDHQPLGADLENRGSTRPQARNRLGLLLLVAGVLAGGTLFVALSSLFQDPGVGIEPPAPAAEARVGGAKSIDAEPTLPDKSEAFFAELGGNIEDIRASLSKIQERRQETAAALDELRNQVSQIQQSPGQDPALEERLTSLDSRLGEVSLAAETIGQHETQLTKLLARVSDLEEAVITLQQEALHQQTKEEAPPPVQLPFRLTAIDSWNGTLFAALSRRERLDLVSAGEQYAGWRVEAIDPSRRRVLFVRGRDRAIRQAPQ